MSAATDLFALESAPEYDPSPVPAVPRRRLMAVPDGAAWAPPVRITPDAPGDRSFGSVSVLHAPEPTATPLRLTRRGVVVVSVLVAAVGAVLVWVAALSNGSAGTGADAGAGAGSAGVGSVTVEAGDTLWSIATRVAPNIDPRAEVEQLRHLNGIDDAGLVPGQQLRVR